MFGVVAIIVLLFSVILHENAHGIVAFALGDQTAKSAGRLTLNPIKHIDPFGSIIMPLFLYLGHAPMFGYAKPVPVSPHQLKGKDRWGFALVALAGPLTNLLIGAIAALFAKSHGVIITPTQILRGPGVVSAVIAAAFEINVFLAAFNLIPIPPLDGSRLLRPALNANGRRILDRIEPFGFVIMLVLILWLQEPFFRLVGIIYSVLIKVLPI